MATNLLGLYTVTRLVARRMAARKEGCIVNVASLMGKIAAPTMATYSATKFAILGFTQALRCELASHNVRVVALLPSLTDTDMVRGFDWFRWVQPPIPTRWPKLWCAASPRGSEKFWLVGKATPPSGQNA